MKEIKDLIIYEKGKVTEAKDIFKKIKRININYNQENFLIFCLSSNNKVLSNKVLFKGGLNACLIDLKTIFKEALLKNAVKIIIAHNHPSKNLSPSQEDKDILTAVKNAGLILNIVVLDGIIFNKKEYYSFSQEGVF